MPAIRYIPGIRAWVLAILLAFSGVSGLFSASAAAATIAGATSQHGVVRVYVVHSRRIEGLIIQLWARCTDHHRRAIWPGFQAPFARPEDSLGRLGDDYKIRGRNFATGAGISAACNLLGTYHRSGHDRLGARDPDVSRLGRGLHQSESSLPRSHLGAAWRDPG